MPRQQHLFDAAKATPPALAQALPRPRLLDALHAAQAPARWLVAPTGSGKSTVAAQFAQQGRRRLLWYRLDERDDDPALFHPAFARASVQQLQVPAGALPPFAETDQRDDSDFAARFAAALQAALAGSPPALIVFDDSHRAQSARLQRTLAAFALAAGGAIELLFVGEEPPPPALFDAIAARRLALCADLDLRFSAAECGAIARSLRLKGVEADTLATLTGGHAAALVIACELLRGAPSPARQAALAAQLHGYLLERLVARLTNAQRELLLALCLLPRITSALGAASAGCDVQDDLDAAADRGLLIRHPADDGIVYEMHGLVRGGLRAIAEQQLGRDGLAALAARTALLLQDEGLLDDAFETCVAFGLAERAADLLPALAEQHARRQQPQSLLRAMARVPAQLVAARPVVSLLAGHALLGIDEAQATAAFARAYLDYEQQRDGPGMALAAASQLIAFNLKCAELRAVGLWLERFHRNKAAVTAATLPAPWRGIFQLGVLAEANMGDAGATTADECRQALDELIACVPRAEAWLSADQQIAAATLTLLEAAVQRSFDVARSIGDATQQLASIESVSALRRGRWWQMLGLQHCYAGDMAGAERCLQQLQRLIDAGNAAPLRFEALELRVEMQMRSAALDQAETGVAALGRAAQLQVEHATAGLLGARLHLLRGRPHAALASIETSLASLRGAGLPRAYLRVYEVEYAYALLANGRAGDAVAVLAGCAASLADVQKDSVDALHGCAQFLASGGRDLAALRTGLALANRTGFHSMMRRVPAALARLAAAALDAGIETGFVHELIRRQQLAPPADAGAAWPWPVRVRILGGFALTVDGQPYRPERKAQDRPLDLLKLLAVHDAGGSQPLSKRRAAELLWPDADDANAMKSLDMALMRLRRLLGTDDAITVSDGRLVLAADRVWTDLRAVGAALQSLRSPTADPGPTIDALLDAYSGHLLADHVEASWLIGERLALWQAVSSAVLEAGARLSGDDATGGAANERVPRWLQRLQAIDPADERIARARMEWHAARREQSQALQAYAACKAALASTLGIGPSAATEQLRAQILAAGAPAPTASNRQAA